ncbi:hypothetical protein [Erythrobacter mangrovi]|uniref:Uncharacterized protein n=1 Tax=Erythrobacter mangrovi TaxID=2739433 RepID=A0A7D4ATL5_9SPHN|nr:hypothetical protein [Erythrobacter mangrovi]QKG71197.1 hypothetical protein HQR01_07310 [Erythrobacter mangrovi]
MFALFLVALFALTAVAALGVLADSGLRWWSAFGQLRREVIRTAIVAPLPDLRPTISAGGCSGFGRGGTRQPVKASISRVA